MSGQPAPNYTHQMHAKACAEAAKERRVLRQYVQVNFYGAHGCGVIKDAYDDPEGSPMWTVQCFNGLSGRMNFPVRLVRQCSGLGDGKCQCEIAGK